MDVRGKTIVVTGAGGGIGGEIVLELIARGARVAMVDRTQGGMDVIRQRAGEMNQNLSLHTVDISDKVAVENLPSEVVKIHGQIDGVVNCAGIIQPFVKLNNLDYEAIERVMNINFYGTLYMTKAFLPILLTRPQASLVNVSSMGGFLPVPGQTIYGASKAAVKLMTEGLFAELIDSPVKVTIVFPGATQTDIASNSGVNVPKFDPRNTTKKMPILSPSVVASQIVDAIVSGSPQVFTGKDTKFLNRLYRLRPVFAIRFISKKMSGLLSD